MSGDSVAELRSVLRMRLESESPRGQLFQSAIELESLT